jgi:hypothetical protein
MAGRVKPTPLWDSIFLMGSPQASLRLAVREIVDVLFARAQKLEEINIFAFARLADA